MPLIGRLAIQCKMITMEQLQQATREQGCEPERRLGDILIELGFVDSAQLDKLKKLQRILKRKRTQGFYRRLANENCTRMNLLEVRRIAFANLKAARYF